jgi:hypothetical protein
MGTAESPSLRLSPHSFLAGNRIGFYPTYGNTLMGLAASVPLRPEDQYSVTYFAPQPRAVLRVVAPDKTDQLVAYGQRGRVELTTLTKEFFMPRFLERDEAIRREPRPPYAWDGVGEVRPFGARKRTLSKESISWSGRELGDWKHRDVSNGRQFQPHCASQLLLSGVHAEKLACFKNQGRSAVKHIQRPAAKGSGVLPCKIRGGAKNLFPVCHRRKKNARFHVCFHKRACRLHLS